MRVDDVLQYEVKDQRGGQDQGLAAMLVTSVGGRTASGQFFEGEHLVADDGYYAWYMDPDNREARGALPRAHSYHLCAGRVGACRARAAQPGKVIIHIDTARILTPEQLDDFMREAQRKEGSVTTLASEYLRSHFGNPRRREHPRDGPPPLRHGGAGSRDAAPGLRLVSREEAVRGAGNGGRGGEDDGEDARLGPEPTRSKKRRPPEEESALDRELEGLDAAPAPAGDRRGDLGARLDDLRARLGLQARPPDRRTPTAIYDERAAEAARARRGERADGPAARPAKAARRERRAEDDDLDDGEDSDELDGRRGRLLAKRDIFRRVALRDPGKLTVRGLREHGQYLSSTHGDDMGEELQPIMLRSFLTVFVPAHKLAVGSEEYRELRTIAESIDLMLKAQPMQATDMLMQRFKSCCMRVRDCAGHAGKWLELLPTELAPSATSLEEDEVVRRLQTGELQLKSLEA